MTGPEHYRAAEKCLEAVDDDSPLSLALLAEGQLHATLALAAATVTAKTGTDASPWQRAVSA